MNHTLFSLNFLLGCLLIISTTQAKNETTTTKIQTIKDCQGKDKNDCIIRKFKDSVEASEIRGSLVFQNYCALCHGVTAEGNGRAAKIHNPPPANLTKSTYPKEYFEMIIRKGGEGVGRYRGMPPWDEQLTNEQIKDVINYLMTVRKK